MKSFDLMRVADAARAALGVLLGTSDRVKPVGTYHAVCRDKDGNIKWEADAPNLVTDLGVRLMLDTFLSGSGYTATCYVGLKGTGTAVVGDTQASHAGWNEVGGTNAPAFTGNRQSITFGSASGTGAGNRTKASTGSIVFTFTSGGTVAGLFINIGGSATKDNTSGTLASAGDFSSSKTVATSDTLTVTYSLSA